VKTLRIVGYAGLVAVAIMLLVEVCVILQDSMISRRAHRQELTGSTLSSPSSLDHFSSVGRHRFRLSTYFRKFQNREGDPIFKDPWMKKNSFAEGGEPGRRARHVSEAIASALPVQTVRTHSAGTPFSIDRRSESIAVVDCVWRARTFDQCLLGHG
jgi:hypothetical protein